MFKKIENLLVISVLFFFGACQQGFERFAPPANSISGRGAKQNPRIVATIPANGGTVSPVTGANGTELRIQFDMTMRTDTLPVLYTYVRDEAIPGGWISVSNSGYTWTWSSTQFANDTLIIQLGWVRWPENNVVAFDFNNDTLQNLDDMPLANDGKLSFTVGWNPGRYKVVPTGQEACYYYSPSQDKWIERVGCIEDGGEPKIGSQDYPAGQNGFIDPINPTYGITFYGASSGGVVNGKRFVTGVHPQNLIAANCNNVSGPNTDCHPYSIDSVTTLVWKTCSQGQYYYIASDKCMTSGADFSWGDAVNACSSLNTMNGGLGYGGRRDWRLPTVYELETLVDYGARITFSAVSPEPGTEAPAIHGYAQSSAPFVWEGPFPNTPMSKGFWTATGIAVLFNGQTTRSNAYVVEFKKGHVGQAGTLLNTSRATTNRHKVRCVAGPNVAPPAQSFTSSVVAAGGALGGNAATFVGPDSNATFNVTAVNPAYDVETAESSVSVTFNKQPNAVHAGTLGNYCIGPANATSCAVSSPAISTALPTSTNTYKLTLASTMGANTAYKIFVSNIQSASDVWQTATAYNAGAYLIDSGTVYAVINSHTSTSIPADLTSGYIVALTPYAGSTPYTAGTKLYVPSLKQVVNVNTSYTATGSATNDINAGFLTVVKTIIDSPAQSLTLDRALFNGPARADAPAPSVVFNVTSASAPNLSSVQVTFNRLPDATAATNAANYCIISAAANPWDCSSPLAAVSAVTLSGYTATLSTTLTASTPYAVLVSNITYRGSHVVDDAVNKLRWQKCRKGVLDTPTCDDDGVSTNDNDYWNDALNYCDRLNHERYDGHAYTDSGASTLVQDRYRWRAPTINELKSISDRSLLGTVGVSMDTTLFPTPNLLAEEYHSSTSYALSGPNTGTNTPYYDRAWAFNFFTGFTSISQRDHSELWPAIVKPPKKNIRCVRSLP